MGDPKEEEREGGGTEGYESGRARAAGPGNAAGLDTRDVDEGGVVNVVLPLT